MPVSIVLSIHSFLRNNFFFFFSLDHLTVTEPVAVLKAAEVWGALRGKPINFAVELFVLGLYKLLARLRTS